MQTKSIKKLISLLKSYLYFFWRFTYKKHILSCKSSVRTWVQISINYPSKMKFVLVFAALLAVAFAAPSTLDSAKIQQALIQAGADPEAASGLMDFISSFGSFVSTVVPHIAPIINAVKTG